MVAASYNAGKTGISKQLNRQQASDYYNLLLGEETGRYVYRIIALKEILSDPNKYGFYVDEKDLYPAIETKTVAVDSTIHNMASFAKSYQLSYKELKDLNPWLRDNELTNSRKRTYEINLPLSAVNPQKAEAHSVQNEAVSSKQLQNNSLQLKTKGLSM